MNKSTRIAYLISFGFGQGPVGRPDPYLQPSRLLGVTTPFGGKGAQLGVQRGSEPRPGLSSSPALAPTLGLYAPPLVPASPQLCLSLGSQPESQP